MTEAKSDEVDQRPPDAILVQLLGYVTLAWSTVDEMLTAALFSLLSIDKFEFTVLIGKIEVPTKLAKLDQILSHRKDGPRLKFVRKLKTEMDDLRADRNALTHGVYQGKSGRGELLFLVPSDIILDKAYDDPAYKLRTFTHQTISNHVEKALAIGVDIARHFDAAKMAELRVARLQIPAHLRIDPPIKP